MREAWNRVRDLERLQRMEQREEHENYVERQLQALARARQLHDEMEEAGWVHLLGETDRPADRA